ncbi:probable cation-transporting ATPase 13A3, partial [Nephila pilipes]
ESTPITKVPVPNDPNTRFNTIVNKRNTLFCGTQVLHSRSVDGSPVKAIVYRTGFTTSKGELVRAILFPKPINFKLYSELFKCMVLFFVIGIPPVIYTSIIWIQLKESREEYRIPLLYDLSSLLGSFSQEVTDQCKTCPKSLSKERAPPDLSDSKLKAHTLTKPPMTQTPKFLQQFIPHRQSIKSETKLCKQSDNIQFQIYFYAFSCT